MINDDWPQSDAVVATEGDFIPNAATLRSEF
jgi:hypothetical protein